jgi:hypothetical protein
MTIHQADYAYDRRETHALFSIIQGNAAVQPVRRKTLGVRMPVWMGRMLAVWKKQSKPKTMLTPQGAAMAPLSRHALQGWRAQSEPVNSDGFIAVLDQMCARHQPVPGFRRLRATWAEQSEQVKSPEQAK